MTISAEVEERPLREIHLVAFEHAVREAGVWSVMTAYNKVNGVYCGEQPDLIGGVLRREWGFDGLVMSDWFGTHSTAPAALAGLDLEMPGPSAWLGPTLAAAVRDGQVDESVVDGQVRHVLRLMGRVGILGGTTAPDEQEEDDPGRRAVARRGGGGGHRPAGQRRPAAARPGQRRQRRRHRPQRRPARHGRRQLGGDPAPAAAGGRGAGRAASRVPSSPPRWGAGSTAGFRPSTCGCSSDGAAARPFASSTSTTPSCAGAPVAHGRGAHRPRPVDRPARSRGSPSARARSASRRRSRPTCRARGSSGSRAPGGPCSAWTATSSSTTPSPPRGSGFYGAGSEPVEVTIDLAAGHSYDLASRSGRGRRRPPSWAPGSAASPPDTGDEFERAVARRRRGGRRRGRRRLQRAVGVRGPRPARPLAARASARARRGGPGRQPAHGGGRQRGLPRRDAVGGAGRGGAHDLVPGRGGCGRAGRHARRGGRAVGTAARDVPRQRRGRAGRAGRRGRSVSRRRGQGRLRGGRPRRLPLLRDDPTWRRCSPSASGSPTATSSSTTCDADGGRGDASRWSTTGPGGAPRWCRSTCGRRSRLVRRPDRELVGFAKVGVDAGEQGDGAGGAGRRRLPVLGRRHARVAHGPGPLRGAGGRVVARHQGERRRRRGATRPRRERSRRATRHRRRPRPWTWTWDRLLVEPRRPEAIRERSDAHWFAVAAVCVGAFMGQLDASIVTVALPTLQHTFGVSVGAVTWVGLSYLLVLVATVVAVGRFADMWGRKLLYVYGFVIFTLASVLCGLAPGLGRAVRLPGAAGDRRGDAAGEQPGHHRAGRARPVAGAGHRPAGRGPGARAWPWARRSAGCSSPPGAGASSSSSTSPSGCSAPSRRSCWCPAAANLMARVRFDWTGLGIFFPAVVALVSAISFGAELGWSSSLIVALFVAAAVLVGLFVWHERRDRDPMLDLGLFRNARFSTGIASGVGSYLVMFGVLLLIPFYLERGLGLGRGPVRPGAHGHAAGLRDRGAAGGTAGRPRRGPAAHRERDGARGPRPGPARAPCGRRRSGCSCCWP